MTGEKPRLTALLVDLGLCSQADVDEIVARQLIFGGELEVALLESGRVNEGALVRAHAARTGLKAASAGPLPVVTAPTRAIQDQAAGAIIAYEDGIALVVSADPLASELLNQLSLRVGVPLENRVGSGLRLAEALTFAGGPPLSPRLQKLVTKTGRSLTDPRSVLPNIETAEASQLADPPSANVAPDRLTGELVDSQPGGSLSEAPPNLATLAGAEEALRPPPVARTAEGLLEPALAQPIELRSSPPSEETAPPPADYEEVRRSVVPPRISPEPNQDAAVPAVQSQAEKTEFSRREAEAELLRCRDRDRIVQIALDYCSQYFQYTAVFAVQSHEARGLSSRGPGAKPERLLDLHIPLDLPSAWSRVKETGTHRVARLRASGIEGGIVRDLERPFGRAVLLIPVSVRGRTLLLIWGDDGEEDVDIGHSAPALTIVPSLAKAIERVLLERKRTSRIASQAPAADPKEAPGVAYEEHVTWSQPPASAPSLQPSEQSPAAPSAPPAARSLSLTEPRSEARTGAPEPVPEVEPPSTTPASQSDRPLATLEIPLQGQQTTRLGMSLPPARSSATRRRKTEAGMSIPPAGILSDRPSRPPPIEQEPEEVDHQAPQRTGRESQKTHKNLAPPAPPTGHLPLTPHEVAGVERRPLAAGGSSAPPDEQLRISQFPSDHPKTIKGFPTELRVGTGGSSSVPPSPSPRVVPLLSRRIVSIAERQKSDEPRPAGQTPQATATQATRKKLDPASSPPSHQAEGHSNLASTKAEHPGNNTDREASGDEASPAAAKDGQPALAEVPDQDSPDEPRTTPSTRDRVDPSTAGSLEAPPLETGSLDSAPFESATAVQDLLAEDLLSGAGRPNESAPASGRTMVSRSNLPPRESGSAAESGKGVSGREARIRSIRLSCEELVQRWLDGDEAALSKLIDAGEQAVGALIARFPGPVTEPSPEQPCASDCGRILFALEKMGARATPFVTVRTADEDPDVRRWAVLLLGQLPGRESARCIAERLLDDSALVRRAALASARRAQTDELTRRALRARLEEMIRDTQLRTPERTAAIEAIADIREHLSIPTLLTLLADESAELVRATKWALSVLTRQDFAQDADAWRSFWQEHRNEPREEWLIFAMLQEGGDMKHAAAEELGALLGMAIEVPLDDDTIRDLREKIRLHRQR